MIHVRILPLIFLFCAACVTGRAQLRFSSLEQVFRYADTNAVSLQNARDQQLIAAAKNSASKAALLPAVNASAGFNDNITLQPTLVPAGLFNPSLPEGTFNEYTFGRRYLYSTGVQASWDIVNFQKWFDVKVTRAAETVSQANIRNTRFQVYNQLAQTWYSILLTQKYTGIARANVAAADSIYRVAANKYEAGIFTEENLNRSHIQHIQAQEQYNSLSASLAQLLNQFQAQLNTSEPVLPDDGLATPADTENTNGNSFSVHPLVQVQQAQLQLNTQQLAQSRWLLYPSVTVAWQLNHNQATDNMFSLSGANSLPQQFWGIRLSIPVFNGFNARYRITQATIQLHQQQQVLNNQLLAAQKEDENLQIQYRRSMEEIKQQEVILQLQLVNDSHAKDRYESGIMGLDERLNKFQELLAVQNQYMQSLSNYYINYYRRYVRTNF